MTLFAQKIEAQNNILIVVMAKYKHFNGFLFLSFELASEN